MERTDKIVATALQISRKDALTLIKKGRISANGKVIKDAKTKLDENSAELFFDDKRIYYNKYVYIMMNKPKGVISASDGKNEKTVVDILPDDMKRKGLFPAGRLDKDTTGFVLITDDGDFAHKILSPKNHIPKTYIAGLDKPIDDIVIDGFEKGVQLKDDLCMPASLKSISENRTVCEVTIKQGMYHQIKRMFSKYGITVTSLKRIKMGSLSLDETLKEGESRYLSKNELELIKNSKL